MIIAVINMIIAMIIITVITINILLLQSVEMGFKSGLQNKIQRRMQIVPNANLNSKHSKIK